MTAASDGSARRMFTALAILAALGALTAAPATAVTPPPSDPFYAAPPGLASVPPGTVLRSRQVKVELGPAPLTGSAFTAYQLLYRSNDATGNPVANVTTVIVPTGATPAGGRKLVSVQDAEDSLDPDCAPSYQLQVGEMAPNGDDNGNLAAETSLVSSELALGYDVVIPDAEGPDSEYIVTGMEAHATLDSIRAAERFGPASLGGAKTPVALIGYSGGASDTAAANELQPAYAPELNIVAVAAGGVPVGNEENFQYLDGSVGAGVLMAVSIAVNRAYPQLDLFSLLNAKGKAFAKQVSTGCATSIFASPYTNFNTWTTAPNVFELPRVQRIVAENALGHATPTAPTFYYNAIKDELVWIKPLDALVGYYCAHGARIDYFRDPAAQEHIEALGDFVPLAEDYVSSRFAGNPVPDTCGSPANASPSGGTAPPPPAKPRRGCPRATGRLHGKRLGRLALRMTRARAHRVYRHSSNRGQRYKDFFCLSPSGVRVGYASPRLLRTLPPRQRHRLRGRVVWISTANPYYAVHGVRPGTRLAVAAKRLRLDRGIHVGLNWWYFAPNGQSNALLKVRHGFVEEVGIATKSLTRGRRAQFAFITSFG
jgi:Secretory lipase